MKSYPHSLQRAINRRLVRRRRQTDAQRLRCFVESLESRAVPSTVSWINPDGCDCNVAANWSDGAVPNITQDVKISIAISGPITIDSADAARSLTDTTASLDLTSGSLSLATNSSVSQNVTISSDAVLALSANLTIGGALSQSGRVLTGAGTVSVNGPLSWTGGTMSGSGITNALSGVTLGASTDTGDSETLAVRMLLNAGAGVWYGEDTLNQDEDSTFLNYSNATLEIEGGGTLQAYDNLDSSGTFENNGSITVVDGSATSLVQTYFINSGTVEIASGTMQLGGGGACPWSALAVEAGFTVDSGATLLLGNNFNHEAYSFNSLGYISGAGSVTFSSGVSANFAQGSAYNPSGTTLIDTGSASTANIVFASGSNVGSLGSLTIDTGTVDFSTGQSVTASSLNLIDEGVITGPDTLDVSGLLTWSDGIMEGSGMTVAAGGLELGLADGGYHDSAPAARLIAVDAAHESENLAGLRSARLRARNSL